MPYLFRDNGKAIGFYNSPQPNNSNVDVHPVDINNPEYLAITALSAEQVRNDAWLAQTYEVRPNVIITVRPLQVGKYDDPVLRGLLLKIQSGLTTTVQVTDVNGIKQTLNETELQAALLDGVRQTSENYDIWYNAVNS